jgi:hypothetical protein
MLLARFHKQLGWQTAMGEAQLQQPKHRQILPARLAGISELSAAGRAQTASSREKL